MLGLGNGMQDIKLRALRGGLAKLFGQGTNFALRLAFLVVAARLLEPKDFGLVAMVTVVTATLELFTNAGLSSAAVQRETISEEQVSTLFWINIAVGVVLALVCVAIAPALVAFYSEPRLFWVTITMGAGFLCTSAGVQHNAMMQRQLRYVALAAIEVVAQIVSISVGIGMAFAGFQYWSLVGVAIALPAVTTTGVWIATGWIPGGPHRNAGIRSLLHFGGTLTANGAISYFTYNFDKFILGRVWGAAPLGHYGVASQLINTTTSNLNAAIGTVIFATLSRLQNDPLRFRGYFLKAYSLNTAVTLPITMFLAAFATDIIYVMLGAKWSDAAIYFRALAPAVLVFGVINPLGWLVLASGLYIRSFKISLVIAVLVITACLIGVQYGPRGVAIGFSAAMVIWMVPHILWCLHGSSITPFDLLRVASRPLLSAVVAVLAAYAVRASLGNLQTPVICLIVEGAVMFVVYPAMLLAVLGEKDFYFDLLKALGASDVRPK